MQILEFVLPLQQLRVEVHLLEHGGGVARVGVLHPVPDLLDLGKFHK